MSALCKNLVIVTRAPACEYCQMRLSHRTSLAVALPAMLLVLVGCGASGTGLVSEAEPQAPTPSTSASAIVAPIEKSSDAPDPYAHECGVPGSTITPPSATSAGGFEAGSKTADQIASSTV